MRIKRTFALVLAVIMLFALTACGSDTSDDDAQTEPEESSELKSEISESKAESIARDYVNGDGVYDLLDKATRRNSKIDKITYPDIGSVDVSKVSDVVSDELSYCVRVKGTFAGYDDYGEFVDRYKFDYAVYISLYGEVQERNPLSHDISIQRT